MHDTDGVKSIYSSTYTVSFFFFFFCQNFRSTSTTLYVLLYSKEKLRVPVWQFTAPPCHSPRLLLLVHWFFLFFFAFPRLAVSVILYDSKRWRP